MGPVIKKIKCGFSFVKKKKKKGNLLVVRIQNLSCDIKTLGHNVTTHTLEVKPTPVRREGKAAKEVTVGQELHTKWRRLVEAGRTLEARLRSGIMNLLLSTWGAGKWTQMGSTGFVSLLEVES